jgi:hypothetical protein
MTMTLHRVEVDTYWCHLFTWMILYIPYSQYEFDTAEIIRVAKEDTSTNLADALTKPLPRESRKELFSKIMYGLYFDSERI